MTFGVTSDGFVRKRLADIKIEIENSLRASLGKSINLLSASVLGNIVGIMAERESLIWESLEADYNSKYPDTAEGVSLDNVVSITGISRIPARATIQRSQHLFGTVGTIVPLGTQLAVPGVADAVFETVSNVTLVAGQNEVQTITFSGVPASGNWRLKYLSEQSVLLAFNATAVQVQTALNNLLNLEGLTVAGPVSGPYVVTFAGASGKINHDLLQILDNTLNGGITVAVTQTTPGIPQAVVDCLCVNLGPIPSAAFSLTTIVTPVVGLASTLNIVDGVIGRNTETDTELRARRKNSLQIAGSATLDAIRSEVLNVENVSEAIVFENTSFVTDVNGFPPKSFAVFVEGGEDQGIADAIWKAKPAGIFSFGNVTKTVLDSQNFSHLINFSRPTGVDIYIILDISTGPTFTATAAQIQALIVAYGNALGVGTDIVVKPDLMCALDGVQGITNVGIKIGIAPAPTLDNNISIAPQGISKWANVRTTVNLI